MSIIPYLVSRGSSTIEKLAFAASGGLLLLRLLHNADFREFKLENLLIDTTEYGFQMKFLTYTLLIIVFLYSVRPLDRYYNWRMNWRIRKYFEFNIPDVDFSRIRIEFPRIDNEFNSFISTNYVLGSFGLILLVIYSSNIVEFREATAGLLISFSIILFFERYSKWHNISFDTKLTLHSFSYFKNSERYSSSTDSTKYLGSLKASSWTEVKDKIIKENETIRKLLNAEKSQLITLTQMLEKKESIYIQEEKLLPNSYFEKNLNFYYLVNKVQTYNEERNKLREEIYSNLNNNKTDAITSFNRSKDYLKLKVTLKIFEASNALFLDVLGSRQMVRGKLGAERERERDEGMKTNINLFLHFVEEIKTQDQKNNFFRIIWNNQLYREDVNNLVNQIYRISEAYQKHSELIIKLFKINDDLMTFLEKDFLYKQYMPKYLLRTMRQVFVNCPRRLK